MDEVGVPLSAPSSKPRYSFFVVVALVILVLIGVGVYAYLHYYPHKPKNPYATQTVNAVLESVNPDFVSGMAALNANDFRGALKDFQAALPQAVDASQTSLINYFIGLSQERLGNYDAAIASYKMAAAAGPAANAITRSYAVLRIGMMHMTYFNDGPVIASSTFTGEPYASFEQPGDANLKPAYLRLYEYAASIYPTALAESFVADGYAIDLASVDGATTTPRGKQDVQQILLALKAVDADSPRMMKNPDEADLGPVVLLRKASVYWALEQYGVSGYTKAQADTAWQSALAATAQLSNGTVLNDFTAEMYANFLDQAYGSSRSHDISTLLSRFSTSTASSLPPLVLTYFKISRTDTSMSYFKDQLTLLAQSDPAFSSFLISLGWTAKDFARRIDAAGMPPFNTRSDAM